MQVGTLAPSASPMQVGTPVASLHRMPRHGFAAEEALLQGATLPCSPWQEAHLLNPSVILMDNHIKMMDALCHLDSYGLQFICESAEALRRERMPTKAPPGYCMLQALDTPRGSTNNPLLSQEFYRAASNLGMAIMEPQQVPTQQHPVGSHCPDPEIESAITNMQRHEQALSIPPTDHNNNPWWGCSPCHPLITHCLKYTWNNCRSLIWVPSQVQKTEDRRLKTIAHSLYLHTICICTFVFLLFGFCIIVPHVFFSG